MTVTVDEAAEVAVLIGDEVNRTDENGLSEAAMLTRMMREHQEQIARMGKRRRRIVLRLRDHRVTYREIAEAMGVTEQAVYKIIRGDL